MNTTSCPRPAFPRPEKRREHWQNLNGAWDFSFDAPTLERTITVPFSWASPLSGIEEERPGIAYYRRRVCFDPGEGNRVFLLFGGVDYECEVQVNGSFVGSHLGGYCAFEFDVTRVWDRTGENTIVVKAIDNADKSYQTFGKQGYGGIFGIWQTVWLESRPNCYIDHFVIQTKIDGSVSIDYRLNGEEVTDPVVTAEFGGVVAEGVEDSISFRLEHPRLWDTEDPYLYEGTLTLHYTVGGKATKDVIHTYFGVREIGVGHFGAEEMPYITLNGKPVYLRGVLDQSFNPKGYFTLPTDEDCKEEIARVKRLGLNMARIHIKPEEPLKLYWADKLGVLIMEDMPCFWGEPAERTKELFETQMFEIVDRDINHPSIFYWVIFNETWGLFHQTADEQGTRTKTFLPETQEWVRSCYYALKQYDPTRLVEDNSPCNRDHVETDVNSWHFYTDGYENVKKVIAEYTDNGYEGSTFNYIAGNVNGDTPNLNSECGNVWGYKESAGDSDLSWQYKYMLNEFRRHSRNNGFIFTELHDVINEFNGYYRIDNSTKDLGYDGYIPGMTVNDLHADDYLGFDFPPLLAVKPGELVEIPLFGSSFSDKYHGRNLTVEWRLRSDSPLHGVEICAEGKELVFWKGYGTFDLPRLSLTMPERNSLAVLELFLKAPDQQIIMRNFLVFDVQAPEKGALEIEPIECVGKNFLRTWTVQGGNKVNGGKQGEFTLKVRTKDIPNFDRAKTLTLCFEASAKEMMSKDHENAELQGKVQDNSFMLGYRVDRGANPNAFFMTDEEKFPSEVEVLVDGQVCGSFGLSDCPADSRGCLSWEYQPYAENLSEAGSYGYLCRVDLPEEWLKPLQAKDSFTLTFRAVNAGGLSLYGRKSGRYPCGIVLYAQI